MKLKLACADFTFPLLPHDRVLDLIAMLDIPGVDIGLFEDRSHLWPSNEFKNTSKNGRALGKKLSDRGLKPADIFLQAANNFVDLAPNHRNPTRRARAREWFAKTLDYAAAAGGKHVTALPGVHCDGESKADSLQRSSEELAWRVDRAKQYGITFGVEAHIGSIVPSPKEAEQLIRMTPGLTLTLDYTHFTRMGMPDSSIEPLVKHASHFHCRGACKGRLQASFKMNTIDYARVLRTMNKVNYPGYVGIEYVWIDWEHCNETDNLCETIQFRDFLRSVKLN
jgi:sugar phosphate isomerase/epimerase